MNQEKYLYWKKQKIKAEGEYKQFCIKQMKHTGGE